MVRLGELLWEPSEERRKASRMAAFATRAGELAGRDLSSYHALYRWSLDHPGAFWQLVADFTEVSWFRKAATPFEPPPSGRMQGGTWFPGSTLNFAENLLPDDHDDEVVISYAEGRGRTSLTGRQLRRQVAACRRALHRVGVGKGDRVAGVLGNLPEAVVAMLATASLGAIWSSCSPDFGVAGVVDRLGQVQPKVVFFTTAYQYGGKVFDCSATIEGCLKRIGGIEQAVAVRHLHDSVVDPVPLTDWDQFLERGRVSSEGEPPLEFVETPFDHPLYIMFSSGTTGVPKCITHGVGGTLLQHKKELALHSDLGPGDRLLYFTTCGWMMWNWMASALGVGSGLVLFEGSPGYPDLNVLWDVVQRERVTVLGVSPKYLTACMAGDVKPGAMELSALKTLLSTGAPLMPEQFAWVYDHVKKDLHVASISGGTDIISCFMLGTPTLPVHAGEIQCAGLGMAVEAWNDEGVPVTSEKGELVCTKPFPSMPVCFWNDDDGRKYRGAYFEHFIKGGPEVWRHGDFIEIRETGGIVVYGRSDATLNPGGVRIGTAEIYRQVEQLDEVVDSLAIGWRESHDVSVVLFVKLKSGVQLDKTLEDRIRRLIKSNLTPRHVPRRIVQVRDVPYTRSGKKVEVAVTQAIHGEPVKNLSALANPEALDEYFEIGKEMC